MMRMLPAMVMLMACSAATTSATGTSQTTGMTTATPELSLRTYDGTLEDARDRILGSLSASKDTEAWGQPSNEATNVFRKVGRRLANGNLDVADLLDPHGYEARMIEPNRVVVVWESVPSSHGGALMVGLDERRAVAVESPHSQYDSLTGLEGFDAFVALNARAWLVNTAHRCANAAPSECDGSTSACDGSSAPYRESDSAHNTTSLYQALHEGLLDGDGDVISVQLHGFAHDGVEPHAYVSDGTTDSADANGLSRQLAEMLSASIASGSAASCNNPEDPHRLCGTTNTQGRHANGTADACSTSSSGATGRFLHIEQSKALRGTDGAVHRGLLIEALDALLP